MTAQEVYNALALASDRLFELSQERDYSPEEAQPLMAAELALDAACEHLVEQLGASADL